MVTGNFYDNTFRDWNTSGFADKVYMGYTFTPFEEASYVARPPSSTWTCSQASGGDISQLGMQAASSFLMWATASKSCGSDLTRECVGCLPRHRHLVGRRRSLPAHQPGREHAG